MRYILLIAVLFGPAYAGNAEFEAAKEKFEIAKGRCFSAWFQFSRRKALTEMKDEYRRMAFAVDVFHRDYDLDKIALEYGAYWIQDCDKKANPNAPHW